MDGVLLTEEKKEESKKRYPKAPDWEKVQDNVNKIFEMLDGKKLTYTEKFSILDQVEKTYEREFFNNSVIMFMDSMHKEAMNLDQSNVKDIYN